MPMDLSHGEAEPLSQEGGTLGKRIYEITRTFHIRERRERREGWRKVKATTVRALREGGGRAAAGAVAEIS